MAGFYESVNWEEPNMLIYNMLLSRKLDGSPFVRDAMQQTPDASPVSQTPPPPPAPASPGTLPAPVTAELYSANQTYEALRAQRSELRNQLSRLEDQRREIAGPLRGDRNVQGADRVGSENRLRDLDARIANVERQLAEVDMAVARAAAVPGAIQREVDSGPGEEVIIIPVVLTIFVLFPIALAYARRLWKRGATVIAPVPRDVQDRLDQMAQAIEAIAVETERIGEGQRFLTRVMSEQGRALGAGPMPPVQSVQAEPKAAVPEYRP